MSKTRLDLLLVARGLADSRTKAQGLIMAGLVYHGEQKLDKAGAEFADDFEVTVRGKEHPWVSRGGMKLAKAIEHFNIEVTGAVAMDVGASTGGFTDVLLTHGATKVYAVDVGHGQLDVKLRSDPRVVVMEETNARHLTAEMLVVSQMGNEVGSPPASGGSWRGEQPFGQTPDSTRQRTAMHHADALRKNPTEAEKKLWTLLRASQCGGVKFRRQQSIGPYIVDFVSMQTRLIVELDGGQHQQQEAYDAVRTTFLNEAGYRVIRYWNNEVLLNPEGVVEDILKQLTLSSDFPPPAPPASGRGANAAPFAPILDIIVCDASFISLTKVLPAPLALAAPKAQLVTLIKPQFEVGKVEVSRGKGVIRDSKLHQKVCDDISAWVRGLGWHVVGITTSPITGPKGNVEFLLYAKK